MKLLTLAICLVFTSCAGLEIVTHSPYGSGTYKDGLATYTPPAVPITFPINPTK
jgi:hypothetical protein